MEEFRDIEGFPGYAVSNFGRVINTRWNREMTHSLTQHGEHTVGLTQFNQQHRRSIKVLVAKAFVEGETDIFDTPMLLDGDRSNLDANNIVWRPRWFALMYAKQFEHEQSWWYAGPVIDSHGTVYLSLVDAAMQTGTLLRDIRDSLMNDTKVFPQGYTFHF